MFRDSADTETTFFVVTKHYFKINVHSLKPSIKMALNNKHRILFLYNPDLVSVGLRNGAGKKQFDCIFKIHVR